MAQVRPVGPKVRSHLALFCFHRVNSRNDSELWCQQHKHCPVIIIIIIIAFAASSTFSYILL